MSIDVDFEKCKKISYEGYDVEKAEEKLDDLYGGYYWENSKLSDHDYAVYDDGINFPIVAEYHRDNFGNEYYVIYDLEECLDFLVDENTEVEKRFCDDDTIRWMRKEHIKIYSKIKESSKEYPGKKLIFYAAYEGDPYEPIDDMVFEWADDVCEYVKRLKRYSDGMPDERRTGARVEPKPYENITIREIGYEDVDGENYVMYEAVDDLTGEVLDTAGFRDDMVRNGYISYCRKHGWNYGTDASVYCIDCYYDENPNLRGGPKHISRNRKGRDRPGYRDTGARVFPETVPLDMIDIDEAAKNSQGDPETYLMYLYSEMIPDYYAVKDMQGIPYVSERTWMYIIQKARDVMPNHSYVEGFSKILSRYVGIHEGFPDWKVDLSDVEIEYTNESEFGPGRTGSKINPINDHEAFMDADRTEKMVKSPLYIDIDTARRCLPKAFFEFISDWTDINEVRGFKLYISSSYGEGWIEACPIQHWNPCWDVMDIEDEYTLREYIDYFKCL